MATQEEAWLQGLREKWKEAIAQELLTIPDGRYVLRLKRGTVALSQQGNPMVVMEWQVAEGEYKGATISEFRGLTGERSIEFLVRDLILLGAELEGKEVTELPKILGELEGVQARARVSKRGNFTDVALEAKTSGPTAPEARPASTRAPLPTQPIARSSGAEAVEVPPMEEDEEDPFAEEAEVKAGDKIVLKDGTEAVALGYDKVTRRVTARVQGKLRAIPIDQVEGILEE